MFDVKKEDILTIHNNKRKAVCYVATTKESWRPDASKFEKSIVGNKINGWDQEFWVDYRSDKLKLILLKRIQLAKTKNCDYLDFDNIDGHLNKTGFPLTAKDQKTFVSWLSMETKKAGMGLGLKNSPETAKALTSLVDFHVSEECTKYKECHRYPSNTFFIEYMAVSKDVCKLRPYTLFADLALKKFKFCSP